MNLVHVVLVIIIVGMIMYFINLFIPMLSSIRALLNAVVFILLLIWVLQIFNVIPQVIPFQNIFHH